MKIQHSLFLFLLQWLGTNFIYSQNNVGVGTNSPHISAKLEVESTNQGLLPPRMSEQQRNTIDSPVAGLMIWCNDCGFSGQIQVFNGTSWVNMLGENAESIFHFNQQLGSDIDGEAAQDQSGVSISLSNDGTIIAIGAAFNDGNGTDSGHVRVYSWNGTTWVQMGADINGEAAGDRSGQSVALSNDGSRVAIGAGLNDGNGSNSGHVRVYSWNGTAWMQMGADINGEAASDQSGISLALSFDGTRVAIGATNNDGNGSNSGHVRVYSWNGTTWVQMGGDINGEVANDYSGNSVSISSDGTRVAIGASSKDGNGTDSGHVRVYSWNGTAWIQIGSDINGDASGDQCGISVSLSANGNIVAVGASTNVGNGLRSGQVRVFEWNNSDWVQMGSSMVGSAFLETFGRSVSISNDGTRLVVGAPLYDGYGADSGKISVFSWNGFEWAKAGLEFGGESAADNSGTSVSISGDGTRIAAGATGNAGNNIGTVGHVRVYE
ncbi:MAG: hypothetical protein WAT79_07640 [Saprospiraceae bacterium]